MTTATSSAYKLLEAGADLIVSTSYGKDSLAMSHHLADLHAKFGWSGRIRFVHSDLGRAEWAVTDIEGERMMSRFPNPDIVTLRRDYDLIDGIWKRYERRPDAPSFPSSAARWCTSDWKRAVISKWIRNEYKRDANVVCAIGIRAEESRSRAKKECWVERKTATAPTKGRQVFDWLPIHAWSERQVWQRLYRETLGFNPDLRAVEGLLRSDQAVMQQWLRQNPGSSLHEAQKFAAACDFPAHVAYMLGNERLSCALCVLGSKGDVKRGAYWNPEVRDEIIKIEEVTGYSFTQTVRIGDFTKEELEQHGTQCVAT